MCVLKFVGRLVYWQERYVTMSCLSVCIVSDGLNQEMATAPRILRTLLFCVCVPSAHSVLQMGIYAFLGVAQAIAFFIMGSMFALLTYFASQSLHKVSHFTIRGERVE
jgi:hypothetical protein